jgi:hypothetical protein
MLTTQRMQSPAWGVSQPPHAEGGTHVHVVKTLADLFERTVVWNELVDPKGALHVVFHCQHSLARLGEHTLYNAGNLGATLDTTESGTLPSAARNLFLISRGLIVGGLQKLTSWNLQKHANVS